MGRVSRYPQGLELQPCSQEEAPHLPHPSGGHSACGLKTVMFQVLRSNPLALVQVLLGFSTRSVWATLTPAGPQTLPLPQP